MIYLIILSVNILAMHLEMSMKMKQHIMNLCMYLKA